MIDALSSALQGLTGASNKVARAAENIATAQTPEKQDTVELSEEAVNLKLGEISYKANAAVLRAAEEQADELTRLLDDEV